MPVHAKAIMSSPESAPSKFDKSRGRGDGLRSAASVAKDKAWAQAARSERSKRPAHQRGE